LPAPGEYKLEFRVYIIDMTPADNRITSELRVVEYNGVGTEAELLYDDRDVDSRLSWPGDSSALANEFQVFLHQFMVERVQVAVEVPATSRDLYIWVMNADTLGNPDRVLAADTVTVSYSPALQWVVVDFSDDYIFIDYEKKVVISVAVDKSDSLLIGADYVFLQAVSRRGWERLNGQFAWHRDREIYDLGIRLVVSWIYFDDVQQGMPEPSRPTEILLSNYPNPFNSVTKISYDLPAAGDVSLKVYDVCGRLVETLVDGRQKAGSYTVSWDASGISSGVYFYKLTTADRHCTRKMVLLR